ncbi:MAG TPA: pitrilysin family protein [Planctomycetota bacterium]|nr:pitrilysin family protein [Planctomycetota bacterium]
MKMTDGRLELGIEESVLDNGLKVLTVERHTAPVVSVWAWYRVGSRNERLGITGASHWVEHMVFKGGREFGKGEIFKQVAKHGGVNNGFTHYDFTAYFETLPAEAHDLGLRIEADRMASALFDPAEVESERTVIISEREGAENHPGYLLSEEVNATAFREHPYRWSVLGYKEDLRTMTREDLYGYYRAFYAPNNAILAVAGDFERGRLLDRVRALYGGIPRGPELSPVGVREPEQRTERRVTLRRSGGAALVYVAHRIPDILHDDVYPLLMAGTILSGAGGMGMRGGVGGRTSRLHVALVRRELASNAYAQCGASKDPHLFHAGATVREGVEPERVEAALLGELERLGKEPPTAQEMEKARTQVHASFDYAWDSVTGIGGVVGSAEAVQGYGRLLTLLGRIDAVTAADVQRVAAQYFRESNRTIGRFVPTRAS